MPKIQQFVQQLDAAKRQRDAAIDADAGRPPSTGEAKDHRNAEKPRRKDLRTVRDPVTGKDVSIQDAQTDFKQAVDDPQACPPTSFSCLCAALTPPLPSSPSPTRTSASPTTVEVTSAQSGEEYRRAQDVTAPPDPIQDGSTSDVPIRSEKTSVLFYKTPFVSYEPMFASLERKANMLCLGIFFAIVFVDKFFGGRLLGLVPLGFCVSSGVFLWVKDLIRQGRDVEWSSEQDRGETATVNLIPESVEWMNTAIGIFWGLINPDMFAAAADT